MESGRKMGKNGKLDKLKGRGKWKKMKKSNKWKIENGKMNKVI